MPRSGAEHKRLAAEYHAIDDHDERKEDDPSADCAVATGHGAVIKEDAHQAGAEDLRKPVEQIVESTRARVEDREVVRVELPGVEPVGAGKTRQDVPCCAY